MAETFAPYEADVRLGIFNFESCGQGPPPQEADVKLGIFNFEKLWPETSAPGG